MSAEQVFDEQDQRTVTTYLFGKRGNRAVTVNEKGETGEGSEGADRLWLKAVLDHFGIRETPREWTVIPPAKGIKIIGKRVRRR